MRGPGVPAGLVLRHMVGNADLAPAFAEWAGAPGPGGWRQAFPLRYDRRSSDGAQPSW